MQKIDIEKKYNTPSRLITLRIPVDIDRNIAVLAKKLKCTKTDIIIQHVQIGLKQQRVVDAFHAVKGIWTHRKDINTSVEGLRKRREQSLKRNKYLDSM